MKLREFISQLQAYENQWDGDKEVVIEQSANIGDQQLRLRSKRFILSPGSGCVTIDCFEHTDITQDCENIAVEQGWLDEKEADKRCAERERED